MEDDVQTVHEIFTLKPEEQDFFLGELSQMDTQTRLEYENSWHKWARPEQLAPAGDWTIWLVMAGRGFGKTRANGPMFGRGGPDLRNPDRLFDPRWLGGANIRSDDAGRICGGVTG